MKKHILKLAAPLLVLLFLASFVSPVLAAGGSVNHQLETQTLAPTITSLTPASQNVTEVPNGTAPVTLQVAVNTPNGNGDLQNVTAVFSDTLGDNATITLMNTTGTVTDSKDMNFTVNYAIPYWWNGTITASVTATNNEGLVSAPATATINFISGMGLTVSPSSIDYGLLSYGNTSPNHNVTFQNTGNTRLILNATTPNWNSSNPNGTAIPASALQATVNGTTVPMSNSGTSLTGSPLAAGPNATVIVPMWVVVPSNMHSFVMSGTYTTIMIITATAD